MSEWPKPEKWKDQTPLNEGFGRVSEIPRSSPSLFIAWRQDRRDQGVLLSLNVLKDDGSAGEENRLDTSRGLLVLWKGLPEMLVGESSYTTHR